MPELYIPGQAGIEDRFPAPGPHSPAGVANVDFTGQTIYTNPV